MNILFDIAHPADVHLFRHVRSKLISHGHNVFFMARDKDVVIQLLEAYEIPYEKGTIAKKGFIALSCELISWFFNAFSIIRRHKINLAVSLSSPSTAWAAKLNGITHLMFNDTETGVAQLRMARPATKMIYTPNCLLADWGPKQVRYNGIHDLAYLRPEYFTPKRPELGALMADEENYQIAKSLISASRPLTFDYAIVRFVSWNAAHDWGKKKTSADFQKKICDMISEKMQVFISAEGELPENLEKYRLKISPDCLHDAMAFSQFVVGDGATTATEAAVLGVPSLYVSPFADSLGYCRLLREHGLLTAVKDETEAIDAIKEFLENPDLEERKERREHFLNETIDLVEFIVDKCAICHE
jgi:uncharacterized protein